jgi:hypothetical protein
MKRFLRERPRNTLPHLFRFAFDNSPQLAGNFYQYFDSYQPEVQKSRGL